MGLGVKRNEYRYDLKDEDREKLDYDQRQAFYKIANKNDSYKYTYEQVMEWAEKFTNEEQVSAFEAGFSLERALKLEEGQVISSFPQSLISKYNAKKAEISFEDLSLLSSVCKDHLSTQFAFRMMEVSESITASQVVSIMQKIKKNSGNDGVNYKLITILEQSNIETAELFADHKECLHQVIPSADNAFIENLKITCIGADSEL